MGFTRKSMTGNFWLTVCPPQLDFPCFPFMWWNEVSTTFPNFINYLHWDHDESWHPWMFQVSSWLLRVNSDTSRSRRSFSVTNSGTLIFSTAPFHHPKWPCTYPIWNLGLSHFESLHSPLFQNLWWLIPWNDTSRSTVLTYLDLMATIISGLCVSWVFKTLPFYFSQLAKSWKVDPSI